MSADGWTRDEIAARLNALPFVCWERAYEYYGEITVRGWIVPEDEERDFVLVEFCDYGEITWTTSSMDHAAAIGVVMDHKDGGGFFNDGESVTVAFDGLVINTSEVTP